MSFTPTYADYVNSLGRNPDMTEAMWNALSDADKWAVAGGSFQIRPNDPRYGDLHQQTGGEDGRNVYLTSNSVRNLRGGLLGNEFHGDGYFAHSEDAQSPQMQSNPADYMPFLLPLMFMGAGALVGEGGGLLAGGEAGAADGLNIGLLENLTEPTMQSLNLSGLEGAMNGLGLTAGEGGFTLPEMMQNFETPPINEMNTGGLDSVMQGLNGAPVTDLSTQAGMGDQLRNLVPGGLLSNASSLMRLAGLGLSLSGLGGGGGGGGNTNNNNTNNNGGGKGGNGQGLNITRGEYQRNPITQRQLEQFRYAQPQGLLGGY